MIIDSDYRVGDPQADGRCYISEVHRDKNGKTYEFEYLANPQSLDPQVVMKDRAVRIDAELTAQVRSEEESLRGTLPLTHLQFMLRFTLEERLAIRTAAKADPIINDFLELLTLSDYVYPNHPMTRAGLEYMVSQSLLKQERADEVGL